MLLRTPSLTDSDEDFRLGLPHAQAIVLPFLPLPSSQRQWLSSPVSVFSLVASVRQPGYSDMCQCRRSCLHPSRERGWPCPSSKEAQMLIHRRKGHPLPWTVLVESTALLALPTPRRVRYASTYASRIVEQHKRTCIANTVPPVIARYWMRRDRTDNSIELAISVLPDPQELFR